MIKARYLHQTETVLVKIKVTLRINKKSYNS